MVAVDEEKVHLTITKNLKEGTYSIHCEGSDEEIAYMVALSQIYALEAIKEGVRDDRQH